MPTVSANGKLICFKGSGGKVVATLPDVCKTPTPAGEVPIPYPNIAEDKDLVEGSTTVTLEGQPAAIKGSKFAKSVGDAPGSGGGVSSGTIEDEAEFIAFSPDVMIEGKPVARHTDPMKMNKGNTLSMGGFTLGAGFTGKINTEVVQPKEKPIPRFEAEITSIEFQEGIKTVNDYGTTEVTQPHWKKGENVNSQDPKYPNASKKPAVFLLNQNNASIKVEINITKCENLTSAKLTQGPMNPLPVKEEKELELKTGKQTIELQIECNKVCAYNGNFNWKAKVKDKDNYEHSFRIEGITRLELFVVFKDPTQKIYTDGVWVEVLRKIFNHFPKIEKENIYEYITQYLFHYHGVKYDTIEGAAKYYLNDYTFNLTNYLENPYIVNCHDQASAIQVFLAAFGIQVDRIFMRPFGYIKATYLVGDSNLCNNPFYKGNHTEPIINGFLKRTSFGHHVFCGFNNRILDACAGPHVGDENPEQYIFNSIEGTIDINGNFITPNTHMYRFISFMQAEPYGSFSILEVK